MKLGQRRLKAAGYPRSVVFTRPSREAKPLGGVAAPAWGRAEFRKWVEARNDKINPNAFGYFGDPFPFPKNKKAAGTLLERAKAIDILNNPHSTDRKRQISAAAVAEALQYNIHKATGDAAGRRRQVDQVRDTLAKQGFDAARAKADTLRQGALKKHSLREERARAKVGNTAVWPGFSTFEGKSLISIRLTDAEAAQLQGGTGKQKDSVRHRAAARGKRNFEAWYKKETGFGPRSSDTPNFLGGAEDAGLKMSELPWNKKKG